MKHVEDFYDSFSKSQVITGVNKRHFSIQAWVIKFGLKKNSRILEIGCGIGTYTELLASYCDKGTIDSYDISEENIKIAKERLSKFTYVNLFKGDVTEESFKKEYDFIILPDVLEHIPIELHNKLFNSLSNSLAKNGVILIHIPNPNYLEWCHTNRPDLLQIIDQPLFTNIIIDNIYKSNLYIHHLESYSIWIDNNDYQIIVLKKKNLNLDFKTIEPEKLSIKQRIIKKLKK